MRVFILYVVFGLFTSSLLAQGSAFGVKTGPTIAFQKYRFGERDPLYNFHVAAYIENVPVEQNYSLYAQLGYHSRGSALRINYVDELSGTSYNQVYNNVALQLAAKQKFYDPAKSIIPFYNVGIRVEYNVDYSLDYGWFEGYDDFVNKITYGLSAGGGMEFRIGELVRGTMQLSFHPDVGRQVFIPPINNVRDIYGNVINIPEQKVVNYTFELSFGVWFWRKVIEY